MSSVRQRRPLPVPGRIGQSAVPVLLDVVRGPDGLPADEGAQEVLRGKLHVLQADSSEILTLFTELSAHLVSVSSKDKLIYVTFKCFEEIWRFTTYYSLGLLSHCLEKLLFDEKFWLMNLKEDVSLKVSIRQETLDVLYRSVLMQEGSLFASCRANQMFDSSTSGADLYLEQGEVAHFEPPFLGSGWTVLCLADGARGTAPCPAVEPVHPFHQWFLQTCAENILVGDGKPVCDFPFQSAQGVCVVTEDYEGESWGELSVTAGGRVVIVGRLLSCFTWFTGRKEDTGEEGLLRTNLVKPCTDTYQSSDLSWEDEDLLLDEEDAVISQSIDELKKICPNELERHFKLDEITLDSSEKDPSNHHIDSNELKRNIERILGQKHHLFPVPSSTGNGSPAEANPSPVCFIVHPVTDGDSSSQKFTPLFLFLDGRDFKEDFGLLYGQSWGRLAASTFSTHANDEELMEFLSAARETARKKRLFWPQTRLCFLLGKLCVWRSKFSQARVYWEESLGVPREAFADLQLLAAVYSGLAAVYALQNNARSFVAAAGRVGALLLGIPECVESLEHPCVLEHLLKRAILSPNAAAEAWGCRLLVEHHSARAEDDQALPFLERLLVLWGDAPSVGYVTLGNLYRKLQRSQLSLSSARRASEQRHAPFHHRLHSLLLLLKDTPTPDLPGLLQLYPHLRPALSSVAPPAGHGAQRQLLAFNLILCVSRLFEKHRMVPEAIQQMNAFLQNVQAPPPDQVPPPSLRLGAQRSSALVWLAWLHIIDRQPQTAVDVLDSVLAFMPQHCSTPQEGVVLNMRGVALRCLGDLQGSAESYHAAIDICQEHDDLSNWAVARANLGLLSWKAGADAVALSHLMEALQLFSQLSQCEADFIPVLLQLGRLYVKLQQLDFGRGCYEWALLLAIHSQQLDNQLTATRRLCFLYENQRPDWTMGIIYSQHLVQLLRSTGNRAEEGAALETLSRLYLHLDTQRAYRAALNFTKTSLGIFIDMGSREREAYGWLHAGNLHQLLDQRELVDIYLQAAQNVALTTGDTNFLLKLLEAAGDVFLNSRRDQAKAIPFYRDRALPIAVKSGHAHTRLRLCHKLAEVMLVLRLFGPAVEFAQTAVDISSSIGGRLEQRVACHRLASIFLSLEQYELAEHYYLKTLSLCPTTLQFDEETLYYVRVYQTLGDILFYHLKDASDAAGYYQLALAAAVELGNKRRELQLCTRLATVYHNFLLDRQLSLSFYQRARRLAAEGRGSSAPPTSGTDDWLLKGGAPQRLLPAGQAIGC